MIIIDAPIRPMPFKRVECRGKQRFNPEEYEKYKEELGWYARQAMGERRPYTGAVSIRVWLFKKRRGILKKCWGDIDNFLKAILDSLNGICYLDDAQVKKVEAEKFFGRSHIVIGIREI